MRGGIGQPHRTALIRFAPTSRPTSSSQFRNVPASSHLASPTKSSKSTPLGRPSRASSAIGRAPSSPSPESDADDGPTIETRPENENEGGPGTRATSTSAGPSLPGIPPVITTRKLDEDGSTSDRLHLAIDPSVFEKPAESTPNQRDRSNETFEESTLEFSYSDDGADGSLDLSDDDASVESHRTNMSARLLLKQARRRMHHQSACEEVKELRAEVLALENRCGDLESRLAQAAESLREYRLRESRSGERRAEREKDFMNQLNDMCSTMEATEQNLMAEIIQRDQKIVDLQNLWNEEEMKRMELGRARRKLEKDV